MANPPDVAIVGGGIIGLTCAYFLAKAGQSVEVFDRGDMGREASWAGAGILPPGNPVGAATPVDRLRAIGSMRFEGFSQELRELTGIDNGYLRCGAIEFLERDEAPEILEVWEREGIKFQRLSRDAMRITEPQVAEVSGQPYYLPDCAQVRNPRHLQALIAGCERVGVKLTPHTRIEEIQPDQRASPGSVGKSLRGVVRSLLGRSNAGGAPPRCELMVGNERRPVGGILIAAGSWSESFLTDLHKRGPGVHPVRGQIVLLRTPSRTFTRVLMLGKRYLVPRLDGHVLIGSTEEPEVGFEKANTAEAVADLIGLATRTVPALASAELVKCWSGLRPGSPDGLPFIGPVPGHENVFVATGHFRAGVQLSIGTAQVVTELLTGKPTSVPLDDFAVDRKPHTGAKSAFRS